MEKDPLAIMKFNRRTAKTLKVLAVFFPVKRIDYSFVESEFLISPVRNFLNDRAQNGEDDQSREKLYHRARSSWQEPPYVFENSEYRKIVMILKIRKKTEIDKQHKKQQRNDGRKIIF
jgi:hypothetical protein